MNKLDSNLIQFNHIPITNGVKKKLTINSTLKLLLFLFNS